MANSVLDIDLDDADPNGIFLIDTLGAGGALTLDGALVVDGVAIMDYARQIGILSAIDDSGITFTIVGTDENGLALTEIVTGSAGGPGTAESAGYFKTVSSITLSGASAGDVTIGTVDEVASQAFPINTYADVATGLAVNVTGTVNVTVQQRFDDFQTSLTAIQDTSRWQTITSGATSDLAGAAARGASALRVIVNSHSSGAELQMYIADRTYTS